VLPGMEVQSREEVHLLCLFDALSQVQQWDDRVAAALPGLENNEDLFGAQYVIDATGEYLRTDERLLSTSVALSMEQIVEAVNALGGLCLPAHVDRPSYSILANLGFIPPGLDIAGVELSANTAPDAARARFPQLSKYGMIVNGDAHRLNEIVARTRIIVEELTVSELRLALASQDGRDVEIIS
ncbi:MAG: histidinol phosphatase, partial [Anaerolineae bacterium]|nr:histidinol phosphatase [Anaerolineae bacterium]